MLEAFRRAARPVVRLLLGGGVMYQECASLLKQLFVEVATEDYGLRGRPTNVSRVALLTGLDRKEVRRLRKAGEAAPVETRASPARLSRVLSAWYQDADYLEADGTPRPLPRHGEAPSFDSLVERYGGDVAATTIAKELERGGAIASDADDRLKPLTRYFMPSRLDAAAVLRSGEVLEDIANTVHHNLARSATQPALFEGRATNARVAPAALPAFRQFLEAEAQGFLERVDEWLTRHEAADDASTMRLGLGLYAIRSTESMEDTNEEDQPS